MLNARHVLLFFILIVFQVFVLNHLTIMDLATPHVVVLFVLYLPLRLNPLLLYTLAFVFGLSMDLLQFPVGANALVCVFISAFRVLPLRMISPQFAEKSREDVELNDLSVRTMLLYVLFFTFVYELSYNTVLDIGFSTRTALKTLFSTIYSAVFSVIFVVLFMRSKAR